MVCDLMIGQANQRDYFVYKLFNQMLLMPERCLTN